MSKLILTLLMFTGLTFSVSAGNPVKDALKVNTSASTVEWTAKKVTGKHNGTINIKEGALHMEKGELVGGSFVVDVTSIKVLDMQGNGAAKLEGHLKSDDFFGVEKYPTAKMVITSVKPLGDGDYDVTGDLTIKEATHPVKFKANVVSVGKSYKATANLTIDRSMYDVRYGSGKFFDNLGDNTIYDEFDLVVTLVTE